jgi:hypothetical protein
MQTTPPPSNPSGSNYRETYAYLCGLLPPFVGASPDLQAAYERDAMDQVVALCPMDAFEARLAARIVAMGAHADDSLRSASRAANDPMEQRRCRAQTVSMARQSDAALRSLHRIQAVREKQLAQTHPAAMERAGYWFRDVSVPAPEPEPAPPAAPDPCLATGLDPVVTEAELYAVMYPERARASARRADCRRSWTSARQSPSWSTISSTAPARSCWRWTASGTTAPRNRDKPPFLRQR